MADQVVSTIPKTVNITHYSGDTFSLKVTAPPEIVAGLDWNAQIRSVPGAPVDATFQIIPPSETDPSAYLILPGAVSQSLVSGAPVVRSKRTGRNVQQYAGVYDCQVSAAGADPIRTLIKGTFDLEIDVTRLEITP